MDPLTYLLLFVLYLYSSSSSSSLIRPCGYFSPEAWRSVWLVTFPHYVKCLVVSAQKPLMIERMVLLQERPRHGNHTRRKTKKPRIKLLQLIELSIFFGTILRNSSEILQSQFHKYRDFLVFSVWQKIDLCETGINHFLNNFLTPH